MTDAAMPPTDARRSRRSPRSFRSRGASGERSATFDEFYKDSRDRLLVQRVRQLLASQPLATHNAHDLAALLNTSARTLHRQLKEEGATLQALKDAVRRERAIQLLLRTRRPIKQVAEAAGFRNEKSFIRAFRAWTGQSPGEFRNA